MKRSWAHIVVYGDSGSGKTTFASTAPKPIKVFCFDRFGKDTPYLKRGKVQETDGGKLVFGDKGKLLIDIEYFHDRDVTELVRGEPSGEGRGPTAYEAFIHRIREYDEEKFATTVLDSATFAELSARKLDQYKLNPLTKDSRQWYARSKELMEELLLIRLAGMRSNVLVLCHVDEDKDELHGRFVRNPMLPGKLKKYLAAGYGEFYRSYVTRDEERKRVYLLQTQSDDEFNASTQIDAPDPCPQHFEALWANWKE